MQGEVGCSGSEKVTLKLRAKTCRPLSHSGSCVKNVSDKRKDDVGAERRIWREGRAVVQNPIQGSPTSNKCLLSAFRVPATLPSADVQSERRGKSPAHEEPTSCRREGRVNNEMHDMVEGEKQFLGEGRGISRYQE